MHRSCRVRRTNRKMGLFRLFALFASLVVASAFAPAAWAPARSSTALNSIMDAGSPAAVELEQMKSSMKERLDKKLADMLAQVEAETPKIDASAMASGDGVAARLDKIEALLMDLKKQAA